MTILITIALINAYDASDNLTGSMLTHTTDAKLALSDGKEIVTMNFSQSDNPWYDIVATQKGYEKTLTFNAPDGLESQIASHFQMTPAMQANALTNLYVDTKYFGDDGVSASEVLSEVLFSAQDASHNQIFFDSYFGGKATQP